MENFRSYSPPPFALLPERGLRGGGGLGFFLLGVIRIGPSLRKARFVSMEVTEIPSMAIKLYKAMLKGAKFSPIMTIFMAKNMSLNFKKIIFNGPK